jgi:hypothetical protein
MKIKNNPQVYMEPGTYYVGDLCYVLSDRWDEVCRVTIWDNGVLDGGFRLADGTEFVSFSTTYGDGTYRDAESREYSVDSGGIGCVLMSQIDEAPNSIEGGQIIEFKSGFVCEKVGDIIYFGKIAIETGDVVEEDEDYFDDYYGDSDE